MNEDPTARAESIKTRRAWVVKLDGSLASDPLLLRRWLEFLAKDGAGKVVVVPGGGPFADQVRESQSKLGFSDSTAHRMAIIGP